MGNKYGHLDKKKFAQTTYDNAEDSPTENCGRYIHNALAAAGLKIPSNHAYQFSQEKNSILREAGFVQLPQAGYHPQVGDIVVWLPCRGAPVPGVAEIKTHHIKGHIQVYTGRSDHPWVSDFKQHDKSIPGLPGPGWATKRAVYEIYRYAE